MNNPKLDFMKAGYVFAYDAKTGEVLRTHEKFVEVTPGSGEVPPISEAECEQVRAEVAGAFRGREVEALVAPEGFVLRGDVPMTVDVGTKILCEVAERVAHPGAYSSA